VQPWALGGCAGAQRWGARLAHRQRARGALGGLRAYSLLENFSQTFSTARSRGRTITINYMKTRVINLTLYSTAVAIHFPSQKSLRNFLLTLPMYIKIQDDIMKITRKQLRSIISEALGNNSIEFVYPQRGADHDDSAARVSTGGFPTHTAFTEEDQAAARKSYNDNSPDIDALVPDMSGLNDLNPVSNNPFFVELYLDSFQDAVDSMLNGGSGISPEAVAMERLNISDEYGVASQEDEATLHAIAMIGAKHGLTTVRS
jgi:hypothetical protein